VAEEKRGGKAECNGGFHASTASTVVVGGGGAIAEKGKSSPSNVSNTSHRRKGKKKKGGRKKTCHSDCMLQPARRTKYGPRKKKGRQEQKGNYANIHPLIPTNKKKEKKRKKRKKKGGPSIIARLAAQDRKAGKTKGFKEKGKPHPFSRRN